MRWNVRGQYLYAKVCIVNPCDADSCEGFIILRGALACIESLTLLFEIGCLWGNVDPNLQWAVPALPKVPITHLCAGESVLLLGAPIPAITPTMGRLASSLIMSQNLP